MGRMQRRGLAWLSALPLMAAGSLAAHALAYRIAEPRAHERADVLASTGHGYLGYAAPALAACFVLLVGGLVDTALRASRRRAPARIAAWPFALVPPFGFVLQEHFERLLANGDVPLGAALEPTFLVGFALQLPFALAALVAARVLLCVAERIGCALASEPPLPAVRRLSDGPLPGGVFLIRPPALALGRSQRGPPA
jgi:hypothetical protein